MKTWVLNLIIASPLVLFAYAPETDSLLTWEDYKWLQERITIGPHLSSAIDDKSPWESFDTWQCFETKKVKIDCAKYGEELIEIPGLVVSEARHTFLFDTRFEDRLDCHETVETWGILLTGSARTCIMAAELPGTFAEAENTSLWFIHAIKSDFGYWIKK